MRKFNAAATLAIEAKIAKARHGARARAAAALDAFNEGKISSESILAAQAKLGVNLEEQGARLLLSGLNPIISALETRDARFFNELAEVLRTKKPKWKVAALRFIERQLRGMEFKSRPGPIMPSEIRAFVLAKCARRISHPEMTALKKDCPGVRFGRDKIGRKRKA